MPQGRKYEIRTGIIFEHLLQIEEETVSLVNLVNSLRGLSRKQNKEKYEEDVREAMEIFRNRAKVTA